MSSNDKPTILCLHGGGTTGQIFNIQTIRLRRELDPHFTFTFIDAPFETGPGPNVLPTFEGAGPYLTWRNLEEPKSSQAPKESVEVIKAAIEKQVRETGKHFVGVMGFSEGARMTAGVVLGQQLARAESGGGGGGDGEGFLFAVMLNGTTPPLTLTPAPSFMSSLLGNGPPKITLPSIHVVGLTDPWRDDTRKMAADHFDSRSARVLEFNVGHHLPTAKADSVKLANEIVNLYHRIIDNF